MERAVVFSLSPGKRDSDAVSFAIITLSLYRYLTIHPVHVKFLPEKRSMEKGSLSYDRLPCVFELICSVLFRLLMKVDVSTVSSGADVLLSSLLQPPEPGR